MELPRPRDISLTAPVAVTLPAFVWTSFIASYSSAEWACDYASMIAITAQEQTMDPVWLKERDARASDHSGHPHEIIARILNSGGPPDLPPNVTDVP
jgi:hypothetical protein